MPESAPMQLDTAWQLDVVDEHSPSTDDALALPEPVILERHDAAVESTPPPLHRILEAILFASLEPLPNEKLLPVIRGLTPVLLEQTISDLNVQYQRQAKPYAIQSTTSGYRLTLRKKYQPCLVQLYGGLKEVRLAPHAIEALSIIAYRQPISLAGIEAIQGNDCRSVLRLLLRRGLVQIQANHEEEGPLYGTTSRFLELFHLNKVEDLPRADDLERL